MLGFRIAVRKAWAMLVAPASRWILIAGGGLGIFGDLHCRQQKRDIPAGATHTRSIIAYTHS